MVESGKEVIDTHMEDVSQQKREEMIQKMQDQGKLEHISYLVCR